ncbi:hypothetical protein [Paraliomyxa miuraensis]|uniref:hypothetical protein n=1 Tax=Paraliomyxa miuraensis TaxID=376150 RepID=UPI00225AD1C2|nr:hypothetical protein [Paraliomyxa miuraensis]MCX4246502.1 hypothetical protein [Paraliomyxa miuraensis]
MSDDQAFEVFAALVLLADTIIALAALARGLIALEMCRSRSNSATVASRDIDSILEMMGLSAGAKSKTLRGAGTPAESAQALRAPLSGRPCLGFLVELGHGGEPDSALIHTTCEASESIPFQLDGKQTVTFTTGGFRMVLASEQRSTFRLDEVPAAAPDSWLFICLEFVAKRGKKAWNVARLHEWIIPVGEAIEVIPDPRQVDRVGVVADGYRAHDVDLMLPWIYVGARNDAALVDRLRRLRIVAVNEFRHWRRRYWSIIPALLVVEALAAWLFVFVIGSLR